MESECGGEFSAERFCAPETMGRNKGRRNKARGDLVLLGGGNELQPCFGLIAAPQTSPWCGGELDGAEPSREIRHRLGFSVLDQRVA